MSRSPLEKQYLPSVPSPLNPDVGHTTPPRTRSHARPRPGRSQTAPALSYAQHILRAKAAEAWRSEYLRRAYQPNRPEQDLADCPLSRAALDMNQDYNRTAVVDLEHSLGLDPVGPAAAVAADMEKPSFGLLQPFTVDLSHAAAGDHPRPVESGEARAAAYRGVARKVLLALGLLLLSFCLLPSMRHRAAFKQSLNS